MTAMGFSNYDIIRYDLPKKVKKSQQNSLSSKALCWLRQIFFARSEANISPDFGQIQVDFSILLKIFHLTEVRFCLNSKILTKMDWKLSQIEHNLV